MNNNFKNIVVVLATSHIVGALGLSLVVSRFFYVSKSGYLMAAVGALMPDFDFLAVLIFGDIGWHRAYLNFIWIPFLVAGVGCILFPKRRMEVMMFSLGYLSHVILDFINADILIMALIDGIVLTIIISLLLLYYMRRDNARIA